MNTAADLHDRVAPSIRPTLERYGLDAWERSENVTYAINREYQILYVNPAWFRFSRENGGEPCVSRHWSVGARLLDGIARPLVPYVRRLYSECIEACRPDGFDFECSGAHVYRRYRQSLYPVDPEILILVNSLIEERPFEAGERPPHEPDPGRYLQESGVIVQCCHCRRVERVGAAEAWDWVPAWVERSPAETSHGLCPICLEYFYPEQDEPATV